MKQDPNSTQGTPTGTVTFSDTFQGTTSPLGTPQTLNSSGNASLQLTTLAVGTHVITANYSGDTYYSAAASNPLSQVVQEQVTVTIASSSPSDTSAWGSTVIFTATVAVSGGIPVSGSVSFYNGATYMGSGTLSGSGVATYATATLPVGSNPITASYTDTNNVTATSSVLTQIVEQNTATSLTSSVNPSIHGTPVTFTAVVVATGTTVPTGTVTFYDGGTQIGTGTLAAAGTTTAAATFQTSTLAAGSPFDHRVLWRRCERLQQHLGSAGADGEHRIVDDDAGGERESVDRGQGAHADRDGHDEWRDGCWDRELLQRDDGTGRGHAERRGRGDADDFDAAGGKLFDHRWLPGRRERHRQHIGGAVADGDSGHDRGEAGLERSVGVVTTPVTFTATVSGNGGAPTGNVTFMDGTNTLGSVAVSGSGVAAYTTSSLTVGTHNITAVYGGDANDAGSTSAALTETVTAYGTQTSLAASSTSLNTDQELTLLTTTTTTSGGAVTGTIT